MSTSLLMGNAGFIRKQLIVCAAFVPALYGVFFFPLHALLFAMSLLVRPLYGVGVLLLVAGYITVGVTAWRRRRFVWTALFVLLSTAPIIGQFIALPAMQQRHFREYRRVPEDAKILYYRQSGMRDVTRFCIIQHPKNVPARSNVTHYRPFLPGALSIMSAVQGELGIPDSKMPDPNKKSVFYSGGSNEQSDGMWMYLDVYDSATSREWCFVYGY